MNPTQAENLRILIRHMDTLGRTLYMEVFSRCGTPACALGEACTIKALNARGLLPGGEDSDWGFIPTHAGIDDVRGRSFFGIDVPQSERLFDSRHGNAWKRADVTPQEWAVEARKVLSENGYSMDEPKPAQTFESFMAKALEPVDVTEGERHAV